MPPQPSAAAVTSGPDPFALLDLPARYDLELATIEARFREKSRALHPDRFAGAPAAERARALVAARALNDAYQVVRRPQRRAEALLARAGLTIGDHERLDPEFLTEILELREELAEARLAGRVDEVGRLAAAMAARRRALEDGLTARFAAGDAAALELARRDLITLRYVMRYLEECDAALDERE
ncbi:MAG: Fe-S protein assembly co-chaperone HscB [Kofleriaceae bacterium]|nr:Fe-S protein assembly co-chaperone HscB [Kofleriaceae bacterium]MCL4227078.1 Fe-S protein assembly co-chaperone HscB [Myxococcales bacterium]